MNPFKVVIAQKEEDNIGNQEKVSYIQKKRGRKNTNKEIKCCFETCGCSFAKANEKEMEEHYSSKEVVAFHSEIMLGKIFEIGNFITDEKRKIFKLQKILSNLPCNARIILSKNKKNEDDPNEMINFAKEDENSYINSECEVGSISNESKDIRIEKQSENSSIKIGDSNNFSIIELD